MKMEINGANFSMLSDYHSIDELDSEAREDLEVALYGMLHHASNEEEYCLNPTNNINNSLITQAAIFGDGSNNAKTESVHSDPASPNVEQPKVANFISIPPVSLLSNIGDEQTIKHLECMEQTKVTNKNKPQDFLRNIKPKEQYDLKRNPYSQRLIIEESCKSSQLKKKPFEVITLSDEEDSKYASINKSSKLNVTKRGLSLPSGIARVLQVASISLPVDSSASSPEDSESDSSVTVLDPLPGPSCMYLDSSPDSSPDSSDSEIEIMNLHKSGYDKVNIKLNVNQPNIGSTLETCINSSSSNLNWEKYSSEKWTPEMIKFYDRDGSDRDLEAILKSLPKNVNWHLDIEDRRGSDLQRNRYFGKSAKMRCTNCSQWDHLTKDCRDPRKVISCGICGLLGHKQFACPNKMCLGCGRPSKILIECCPECRREQNIICMICRSKHVTQQCPDLWRRYHSTTSNQSEEPNNTGNTLKPSHQLFCCNCAGRGHLVHDCPEKRWSKYLPANPTIFSYKNPRQFLNSVTSDGKSSISISEDRKEIWVVGNNVQSQSPRKGGRQTYTMPHDRQPSEGALQAARNTIFRELKHIEISWRKQPKKGRMVVEFSGNGDTKEAKNRFKKLITFKKKAESRKNPAKEEPKSQIPNNVLKEKIFVAPKVGPCPVSFVDINHVSRDGKHMHRRIRVNLNEKEKRNAGRLLAKLEFKNRVQITSCQVGNKWEVMVHNLPNGNALSAVNSIVSYLDVASARPGGV
ncbi:putative Zinc finger CCHC domain-containing protein [Daphnia magna]|uniref:Zinc finger CCHC domain-containing protein 7 n=1 Tax=Daphnia magna TaxID=35525 RepID=A0A164YSI2_9CRUS|nr:putative Zinc finger CCHC domain-containing protein [Daphnia magna]